MSETIIKGTGAVLVEDGKEKIIALSDLHLSSMDQTYAIIDSIKGLVKKYKPTSLVVIGDFFNLGHGGEFVDLFDREVSKIIPLNTTMGNHDLEIFPHMVLSDSYCFMHGDNDYCLDERPNLIIGHTHPYFKEKRVFMKGVLTDNRTFIVLPVFNESVGGPDVRDKENLLGFIFRDDLIKNCDVLDLDGKKIFKYK